MKVSLYLILVLLIAFPILSPKVGLLCGNRLIKIYVYTLNLSIASMSTVTPRPGLSMGTARAPSSPSVNW